VTGVSIRASLFVEGNRRFGVEKVRHRVGRGKKSRIVARAASARRKELRHALHFELLRHLVRVGVVAAKNRTELAKQFRLLRGSHLAFLTAAKGMLAKAEGLKDALVSEGMSETLLEDLSKAVEEFEAASEASRTGRRDHVGARVELAGITLEITERIRLLDGLVRYRFRKDGELLGAWMSASNVPGPSRAKVAVKPDDGVVPSSGGGVAPAA
jgi:hypothetical protein